MTDERARDVPAVAPAAPSARPSMLYACVYAAPGPDAAARPDELIALAEQFSPRYERHGDALVSIDVSGLTRLLGTPHTIASELRREAADRGHRVHVAVAASRITALVLAVARAGVTVVARGDEAAALLPLPLGVLDKASGLVDGAAAPARPGATRPITAALAALKTWGIRTAGEFAALPSDDVRARLGGAGVALQAMARGEDVAPLVPTRADERFDASLELEWPIDGLEPLSFVLTRLLEPLSTRLERRDRGAAALHLHLRLVSRELYARRLELPTPMRDVRTLRTLALLDLESHPPSAAIDAVTITIDPTPARVLQHTLFTRPVPTPEQLSTLLARLTALMGADRLGAAATVDSYRPGAFTLRPFALEHATAAVSGSPSALCPEPSALCPGPSALCPPPSALRRCRHPVPARVQVDAGERPVRVTSDRRGFVGGVVTACRGPWRTSGAWWEGDTTAGAGRPWSRDEWDVTLADGAVYRIFRDRATGGWFFDAIVD